MRVLGMNYLDLCPELERHGPLFRVRLDPDLLATFLSRFDATLVTVELCHQFAVRCVRATVDAGAASERFLPVSLRQLSTADIRQIGYLFGQVSREQQGGTVQIYSSAVSAAHDDLLCSVTVMALRPMNEQRADT